MFAFDDPHAKDLLQGVLDRDPALGELLQIMDRYHVMAARVQAQAALSLALGAITGKSILDTADVADADGMTATEEGNPALAAINHEVANLLRSINASMAENKMGGTH